MEFSVCITTFNEKKNIEILLDSLFKQSQSPNEVVIIDSKSTDSTVNILRRYKKVRLIVRKCSRAQGRNLAVKMAKYNIIAMTDAGCFADTNWLKRITWPFRNKKTDIVAGFYKMKGDSFFQRALSCFLGARPQDFNDNFLPSARSIAFTRGAWKRVGGFPEDLEDTAEDTVFIYKAIKKNLKIVRVKNAFVYWILPNNLLQAMKKFYAYAKGDAKSKIFWHPIKKLRSHNIKAMLVLARYVVFLFLAILGYSNHLLWLLLVVLLIFYIFYAFYKVFKKFNDIKVGIWGVVIQFCCDLAVMIGFVSGILS